LGLPWGILAVKEELAWIKVAARMVKASPAKATEILAARHLSEFVFTGPT
jgi:hypothetical protein